MPDIVLGPTDTHNKEGAWLSGKEKNYLNLQCSVISAIATEGHMVRLECSTSGDSRQTQPVSLLPSEAYDFLQGSIVK